VGSRSQIKTGLKGRLGLTVGKKVGDAPVRNLIKRRLRSIFRENRATFDGMDVVVIALPSAAKAPYEDLMRDLLTAASNLKARIAKLSEQRRYGSSRNRQ
jgi:ribonuclease P protein component